MSSCVITPVLMKDDVLVFHVKNGKGLLRIRFGSQEDKEAGNGGFLALVFDDVPLIRFHGDAYFCPTCEKLVSAGYGRDKCTDNSLRAAGDSLNGTFESIEKCFDSLKLLLGLLPDGYYALSDEEVFPTDGNGNFFWSVNNTATLNRASCPVYENDNGDFRWSVPDPKYLLPTQPPRLFNAERVAFYRGRDDARALAVSMEGYLCALLDGHHKATAAALDGRPIRTIMIHMTPVRWCDGDKAGGIELAGVFVPGGGLPYRPEIYDDTWKDGRLQGNDIERYLSCREESFDDYPWPKEILDTARAYPDVRMLAFIEWAGNDLSDERLKRIVTGREADENARYVVNALFASNDARRIAFAVGICRNRAYVHLWHNVFLLLASAGSREVEDFFIDYLINDDGVRPDITRIVDDYFRKMPGKSS